MKIKGYNLTSEQLVLVGSALLNALLWILVLTTFPKNDPSAILHYTAGVGIDFVGSPWQIFVLPSISTAILVMNALLAFFVRKANEVAFWVFLISIPILACMVIGTYVILLRLNS